ncbi:hypothetical protein [Sorangium sp. So ce1151]|uniref:hypothetical protein n=1 Tax=Sorangium sp. So ce1151 TaxID=3133332 RepID=UPI003F63A780
MKGDGRVAWPERRERLNSAGGERSRNTGETVPSGGPLSGACLLASPWLAAAEQPSGRLVRDPGCAGGGSLQPFTQNYPAEARRSSALSLLKNRTGAACPPSASIASLPPSSTSGRTPIRLLLPKRRDAPFRFAALHFFALRSGFFSLRCAKHSFDQEDVM